MASEMKPGRGGLTTKSTADIFLATIIVYEHCRLLNNSLRFTGLCHTASEIMVACDFFSVWIQPSSRAYARTFLLAVVADFSHLNIDSCLTVFLCLLYHC